MSRTDNVQAAAAGVNSAWQAPVLVTGALHLDGLADMLSAVVDGGIVLSKVLKDNDALPRQVLLYREFVRAVFQPPGL